MLVVFGDSHSLIWRGQLASDTSDASVFPNVRVNHLGPALTYNLMGDNCEVGKWGEAIISHGDITDPDTSAIMLCFGEIDCRTQVIRRAISQKLSIREVCIRIADRYFEFVERLQTIVDVPIVVCGPTATASATRNWDFYFPSVGTEIERNTATREFTALLYGGAESRENVFAISVFEKMVSRAGATLDKYTDDGCHLNFEGLDLAIEAFREVARNFSNTAIDYFFTDPVCSDDVPRMRDISDFAKIIEISSSELDPRSFSIVRNGNDDIFVVDGEGLPWVIVDIGFGALVERIEIFRSTVDTSSNVLSFEVYGGVEHQNLDLIYQHDGMEFGILGIGLPISNPSPNVPLRFLKIGLRTMGPFHLAGIKIHAKTFMV